ncbi:MAG: hypothetical protein WBP88_08870, partial [Nitrososphaeraceae archaeon]
LPFMLAKWKLVCSEKSIDEMFNESKELGYEGLVLKDPNSEYQIGKRGKNWIKLKKELDTLDVVVVMAEYGNGKRLESCPITHLQFWIQTTINC